MGQLTTPKQNEDSHYKWPSERGQVTITGAPLTRRKSVPHLAASTPASSSHLPRKYTETVPSGLASQYSGFLADGGAAKVIHLAA